MLRLVLFSGWLMFRAPAHSQDTNFWIFLCFGQSNMEGFPGIEEQDKTGGRAPSSFRNGRVSKSGSEKGELVSCCASASPPIHGSLSRRLFWPDDGFQSSAEHQSRRRERLRRGMQNRTI
jgi:hypothetical protein